MAVKHLRGINVYQDDKGRDIYYDRLFTKKAYLIPTHLFGKFSLYQSRYIFPIAIFALLAGFIVETKIALLISIAVLVVMEILFRFKFLPDLPEAKRFKPSADQSFMKRMVGNGSKKKMLIRAALYLALAILLVLNAMQMENLDTLNKVVTGIISAGAVILSIITLIAALQKKD